MSRFYPRAHRRARRGAASVLGVVMIGSLMAVAAFAIDFGHISVSRSEVKRTADAAALSACWELYDGVREGADVCDFENDVFDVANEYAAANSVASLQPSLDQDQDIEIGTYTPGSADLDTSDPSTFNAVRVSVRQTSANQSSIPLFLGSVTGRHEQSLESSSTAALFRRVEGFYRPPTASQTLNVLPIALDLETWEQVVAKQTDDDYAYVDGSIQSGSDGFHECSLYPTGTGAPGNRGTVDIGSNNNSTSDIRRQILHGISQSDMDELGRPLEFDSNGELELNGDTGLSAAIKAELTEIIGEPRIIPIFTKVQGNGNNAMYTIVRWEGIRILKVKLTGPMKKKHVTIQPCPSIARFAVVGSPEISESDFLFTPVMLVE